jgi:hypothetical protein
MRTLVLLTSLLSTLALAQGRPPTPPTPPSPPTPSLPPGDVAMGLFHTPGIPPPIAQRLGLSADTVKKVRDLGFEANEQLIGLEADLKRAQLELEKTLAQPSPEEATVLSKVELVGRAELAVRKNRVALMLRIRKLLGPEVWDRLQAEFPSAGPGPGVMLMAPGTNVRREVRVIKNGDGTTSVTDDLRGDP